MRHDPPAAARGIVDERLRGSVDLILGRVERPLGIRQLDIRRRNLVVDEPGSGIGRLVASRAPGRGRGRKLADGAFQVDISPGVFVPDGKDGLVLVGRVLRQA